MMEDVKRILVMSRSTKDCKKAVHYGISLARTCGAHLTILHVMYDPFNLRIAPMAYNIPGLGKEYRAIMKEVKSDLASMIEKERAEGMAITEMVKDAEPVHELLKVVEAEKIDLLERNP
jgi:nucleotide-binding universal stress UspA family protein